LHTLLFVEEEEEEDETNEELDGDVWSGDAVRVQMLGDSKKRAKKIERFRETIEFVRTQNLDIHPAAM